MSSTEAPAKRKLVNFEAPVEQIEHWKTLAHQQQMNFSAWIRMKLNASDDLPPIRYKQPEPLVKQTSELLQRAAAGDLARPTIKPSECLNRIQSGGYCPRCGSVHK